MSKNSVNIIINIPTYNANLLSTLKIYDKKKNKPETIKVYSWQVTNYFFLNLSIG